MRPLSEPLVSNGFALEMTPERIRLSTDIRFQRAHDLIDQRWTQHWVPDDNL